MKTDFTKNYRIRYKEKDMGYRSDVAYTIRFNHEDDTVVEHSFYTFLAEAKSKPEYALALDDKDLEIDEVRCRINFSANDVKWYEGYPDVDSHTRLLELAKDWVDNEANPSIGYMFMRVGEEPADIEHLNGGAYDWDWMQVSRQIVKDWD